jgi:hypothetical protein
LATTQKAAARSAITDASHPDRLTIPRPAPGAYLRCDANTIVDVGCKG